MNKLLAPLLVLLCVIIAYQWRTVSQLQKASGVAEQKARKLEAIALPKAKEDRSSNVSDAQVQATTDKSREENQALKSQISELQGRLAAFEPYMPGKEHPAAAYFGPGRWVNAERNGLAQVRQELGARLINPRGGARQCRPAYRNPIAPSVVG